MTESNGIPHATGRSCWNCGANPTWCERYRRWIDWDGNRACEDWQHGKEEVPIEKTDTIHTDGGAGVASLELSASPILYRNRSAASDKA